MKTGIIWLSFGVALAAAFARPTATHAQSATTAQPAELAPSPYQGGEPTAAGSEGIPSAASEEPANPPVSSPTTAGGELPASIDVQLVDPMVETPPWSRGVSLEDRRVARELFLDGNRLFRVPLFARAAGQYTAALQKWKHPAFYFNLALAQLNAGEDANARANLKLALEHGEKALGPEEFAEAQKQLRTLEQQLGQLRVSCQTRGAEVAMNGKVLFTGPGSYEGWAKAGTHQISAKRPGYAAEDRRVLVTAGRLKDVDLKLVTLGEASDKDRRWAVWKPWLVVATGAGIAAGGGVFHTLSIRDFQSYDEKILLNCPTDGCPEEPPRLKEKRERAERRQLIAYGSYAAGGALLVTGAVLLYMNRPRVGREAANSRIALTPEISSASIGVSLSFAH